MANGDHIEPQILLQSNDHGQLLNVIDQLRSEGISRYVSLPQVIVCGDQSSGKSSVLEALSGIQFPTKENLCTRFATELILRRGHDEKAIVQVIPGAGRSEEEKKRLRGFEQALVGIHQIPSMIDAAKEAMGFDVDGRSISDDILRIEICSPKQSHLTLVDLPGLVHSETRHHSTQDVEMISSLVRSYMQNRRSIILAVVSAKNDLANQIVTKLAREYDPRGLRTLGIITKPDTLNPDSENEQSFVSLARNEDIVFRLAWHVLRNRDYATREYTSEQRDEEERDFFNQGVWASLPPSILGIWSLKPRLSAVLRDHIISELPSLIKEVEEGIVSCQKNIEKLGEPRSTVLEQRLHLIRISQAFTSLTQAAIDGVYTHDFFSDIEEDYGCRLRAAVSNILTEFASEMRDRGQKRIIVKDDQKIKKNSDSKKIRRSEFIDEVQELMKRSRGRELPGTFNPLIIGDLFYQQASPWEQILLNYAEKILKATKQFLQRSLVHTSDETTQRALLVEIINPAVETCASQLRIKITEALKPYQKGHPITYNHYFIENIEKAREEQIEKELRIIGDSISPTLDWENPHTVREIVVSQLRHLRKENDMDRRAASEAITYMEAYYKVAMKVIVDNFAILAVEQCLLQQLPGIFTPEVVQRLDEGTLQAIAAETEDMKLERNRTMLKLDRLRSGLQILTRLALRWGSEKLNGEPEAEIVTEDIADDLEYRSSATPDTEPEVRQIIVTEPEEFHEEEFHPEPPPAPMAVKRKGKKKKAPKTDVEILNIQRPFDQCKTVE